MSYLSDNTIEAGLEPLDGLLALDAVRSTNARLCAATAGDTLPTARHPGVEVHTVDTDGRVVLDTKIDVLADTETEVASLGEVALAEFVLLDLEATLENFLSLKDTLLISQMPPSNFFQDVWKSMYLGATDGNVDRDLFVTTDTEGTDSVAGLACS